MTDLEARVKEILLSPYQSRRTGNLVAFGDLPEDRRVEMILDFAREVVEECAGVAQRTVLDIGRLDSPHAVRQASREEIATAIRSHFALKGQDDD